MPAWIVRPQKDEIGHGVIPERTIAQQDVRVATLVSAAVTDQADMKRRLRAALSNFIDKEWTFSLVMRASREPLSLGERQSQDARPFARLTAVAHELRAGIIEPIRRCRSRTRRDRGGGGAAGGRGAGAVFQWLSLGRRWAPKRGWAPLAGARICGQTTPLSRT